MKANHPSKNGGALMVHLRPPEAAKLRELTTMMVARLGYPVTYSDAFRMALQVAIAAEKAKAVHK